MDVVVPVLVHMSGVTMVEFWLRSIKLHYSPADLQSQENLGNRRFKFGATSTILWESKSWA
jgi:hypothetical protein